MNEAALIAKAPPAAPCTVVILGASGDLAKRKLIPALYNLDRIGDAMLPPSSAILGFARRAMAVDAFRESSREGIARFSRLIVEDDSWRGFADRLDYLSGLDQPDGFVKLRERLEETEQRRGLPPNRIFYLSIPPEAIEDCVERLNAAGLIAKPSDRHFSRIVVEKPIGRDLPSALEIERALRNHLDESQIYRIDHYLGKEAVQNLLVLRFANSIFEQLWSNRHVDHVQISVTEAEGVGTRAGYYDAAGALRDMVQNHMMQLLSLIAMEPPVSLEPWAVGGAKLDALRALKPMTAARVRTDVVRARYATGSRDGERLRGYTEETGVARGSRTETYVALKAWIDNWRWSGVPFYLRTGKALTRQASAISVQFRDVPGILFNRDGVLLPDVLTLRIQPDEGFSFDVMAKRPGLDVAISPVRMNLSYASEFNARSPDAYERLLLDVMAGDRTLFIGGEFVEKSWEFAQGILDAWENDPSIPLHEYPAGSWGPSAADALVHQDHRAWRAP